MGRTISKQLATMGLGSLLLLSPLQASAGEPGEVRSRAERSFDQLKEQHTPHTSARPAEENSGAYPPDRYWVGNGQGDLAKGKTVCQRVSELSARTDLAKQIRVMVKEHMVDRVRERSGRETEQDIELTREELVQEYLLGVQIVDRHIDEANKICTATAVMLKSLAPSKQPTSLDSTSPASR
ncbi:MAG: conserved exported protein of unknown function [Nitrospira sp.]|nr:MAG: conserved exported protein of unknown function [Nitrospira sp.]